MAGSTPPVETPKLGLKATIAGLIFAVAVLAGFGVATAASYEDTNDHGDDHGEEYEGEEHGEEGDKDADDHSEEDGE